jgi:hypothetical protein
MENSNERASEDEAEPCLEPPVDPYERETVRGDPRQAMDKAGQQVAQEEFAKGSNPESPHGNGSRGKQIFGALGRLIGQILKPPGGS